jgi:hypothetical protein
LQDEKEESKEVFTNNKRWRIPMKH